MQSSMGPKAIEILEAVTGESFAEMRFSRWRKVPILGVDTIVARQGVTGEVGYEFTMPTSAGKGHELWAAIRDAGRPSEIAKFNDKRRGCEAHL
jgi:aminomethyltransferase